MRVTKRLRYLSLVTLLVAFSFSAWPTSPDQVAIAVVVAPDGPHPVPDKEALARIFLRKTLLWANRETIQPVNLSAIHPLRRLFSERVFGLSPEELEGYWNDQYFHGVFPPYSVSSEEAVVRYVSASSSAIGYVSACAVDGRIKVLLYLTRQGVVTEGTRGLFCPKH
jgi:hypothetical protein